MSSVDAKGRVVSLLQGTKATTGYYGLADVKANTDGLFDDILDQWPEAIRSERRANYPNTIPVFGESTRLTRRAPAVYVYRNGVRQDNSPLGFQDFTEEDSLGNPKKYDSMFQVRNIEQLQLLVLAANSPQQRDDLFQIVRELLYRGVPYFSEIGAIGFQVTNARDGQFVTEAQGSSQIVYAAEIDVQFFTSITWTDRADVRGAVHGSFSVTQYEDYL